MSDQNRTSECITISADLPGGVAGNSLHSTSEASRGPFRPHPLQSLPNDCEFPSVGVYCFLWKWSGPLCSPSLHVEGCSGLQIKSPPNGSDPLPLTCLPGRDGSEHCERSCYSSAAPDGREHSQLCPSDLSTHWTIERKWSTYSSFALKVRNPSLRTRLP